MSLTHNEQQALGFLFFPTLFSFLSCPKPRMMPFSKPLSLSTRLLGLSEPEPEGLTVFSSPIRPVPKTNGRRQGGRACGEQSK